jgi:glycosyltransferase involved in cell wall biosynthesis
MVTAHLELTRSQGRHFRPLATPATGGSLERLTVVNDSQFQQMHTHPTKNAPVFSVILPTRDRPAMLRKAVASVCRQSFRDFELIVIDDGSATDYLDGLPTDSRIRIIRNRVTLGVAHARNLGIGGAVGTYISFLDDDDEYLGSFLSSTYAGLKDTPEEIGISWCGAKFIRESGKPGIAPIVRVREIRAHKDRQELMEDFVQVGTGHGVTIKATCLGKVGPFNEALKVASDTDMFFRILAQGFTPLAVPGVHIARNYHRGLRLTGAALFLERIRAWEWILEQHSKFLDENPVIKNNLVAAVESLKQNVSDGGRRELSPLRGTRDKSLLSRFSMIQDWLTRIAPVPKIQEQLQID